ncbi:hypothetical protein PSI23_15960 [Xenorhabdus sp. XENO-10]|uniref:Phage membrane protein n=1 Tax=Xenorhabdus yunnanensis TaxID=3025878 RepID=A0ABT5LIE9_9GAMM|nr:hypothetical protein [Xenorhabdus yunnanensis]MDC9590739.1 hypothetical protein [Xenorhabdus yunnanensis]
MDTTEQINGIYFYDGTPNLTAAQLFFWIMIDETLTQFGITDIAAFFAIYAGLNRVPVSGKPVGSTPGTSYASKYSRRLFRGKMMSGHLPTWINYPPNTKRIMTKKLGTFVGRTIPLVGWVILAADVAAIVYRSVKKYNLIARKKDRLW